MVTAPPEWADLLEPYRKLGSNEHLSIVIDDPSMARLALAWTRIPKTFQKVPASADLDRLWKAVKFDHDDLERATGLAELQVLNGLLLLRRHLLIFPDGTMAPTVSGVIRGKIIKVLNLFQEKPAKETPTK